MISTIELYEAIRERLESTFPNITVQQKDIKNILRPSLYIQYVGKNLEKNAKEYFSDKISFNIIYFSKEEQILELLEIEEAITKAFSAPLIIRDDKSIVEVEKDALQSNLNEEDYFLNATMDFTLTQRMSEDETGEEMEEIDFVVKQEDNSEIYDDSMSDIEI
jgi:hypothetical protein